MFPLLKLLANNLSKGPVTVRFPGQVPAPAGFRGLVRLDPARCLTCGICAYACVSRAITVGDEEGHYRWSYDPGRCTFCARCEGRCPGQALSMDPNPARPYQTRGELAADIAIPRPICPDCGKPSRQTTEAWLHSAFSRVDEKTRDLMRLCERCRRKRIQSGMKPGGGAS